MNRFTGSTIGPSSRRFRSTTRRRRTGWWTSSTPENTYLICLCGRKLAGMLAVRGNRPFSLDQKLEKLDSYLPAGRKICEIRLLAVEKKFRGAQVLQGILALLWQHGIEKGYDLAIISGTTRQFKLYQHLGFVPFGPLVGTGDAQFQPMYVTLETFETTAREFLRSSPSRAFQPSAVSFLPGPVTVRREVRRAFEQAPESHRADAFMKDFQAAKQILCELVQARNVGLFLGSGTLANDVVAGQLSLERKPGLVLSNGEFGERLVDHARRFGLAFDAMEFPWGQPLDLAAVRRRLERAPAPGWLWCAHCETSTGVLNDLERLKTLCAEFQVKLCLDCISSIGTVPVDLDGSLAGILRQRQGVAIVSGPLDGVLPSRGRTQPAGSAEVSRPGLLRGAGRGALHVLLQPAPRASCGRQTRPVGGTLCRAGRALGLAPNAAARARDLS